ncbi:MAG TPA: sorbosone dehydrogenase family protein [Patescibacteria group bacterium]|nr:sorbosone dehydrogenase family protein [Patescibacteria group bacterium]
MRYAMPLSLFASAALVALISCAHAQGQPEAGYGANPQLPAPEKSLLPTVNIAPATGWPAGGKPVAAAGLAVNAFADKLDHPRWLYTLPNGDVLVAESNKPANPDDGKGVKGWFMKKTMKKAGAGVESANRITLLRDADGDGVAEFRSAFLENLHSPFGMALVGDAFYVANTDAVVRFPYRDGVTEIKDAPVKVADLPGGTLNHHWTKNLIASADGKTLYVAVGSNSNIGENGMDKEENRAAILKIDAATGATAVFASGLRNPVGMDWNPVTGELWTAVNERDELGNDLVPDYMTSVKEGAFYGWPYSYYGQHVDTRVEPQKPDLVAKAIAPDYALGAHTASLGFHFYTGDLLPQFRNGALIGQHGSWNREPKAGYKVVYIAFDNGKPVGKPQDVLTGFLDSEENALGRPVGVIEDAKGALLVADDVGNVIWRVAPAK